MKTITLEHAENNAVRMIVFAQITDGFITIVDIAEHTELGVLNLYLCEHHPDTVGVRVDGQMEIPDCLTPFEAAEAALPPRP